LHDISNLFFSVLMVTSSAAIGAKGASVVIETSGLFQESIATTSAFDMTSRGLS
jgi:hypothetical protein